MMPNEVLVHLGKEDAAKALGDLARRLQVVPKGLQRVVLRSLGEALNTMKAEASRMIRAEYEVSVQNVAKTMTVRTSRKRLIGTLKARGP